MEVSRHFISLDRGIQMILKLQLLGQRKFLSRTTLIATLIPIFTRFTIIDELHV